jgi:hypothetical protein
MRLRRREQPQNDYRHAADQWPLIEIAHVGNITNAGKSDEITLVLPEGWLIFALQLQV